VRARPAMMIESDPPKHRLGRTTAEGEGFEPSMDETAHTGFRDRPPVDVDSDAVQGCRYPSLGRCDRYAIETEFWEFWEAVLEVNACVENMTGGKGDSGFALACDGRLAEASVAKLRSLRRAELAGCLWQAGSGAQVLRARRAAQALGSLRSQCRHHDRAVRRRLKRASNRPRGACFPARSCGRSAGMTACWFALPESWE
jgi:hypothetical protein